MTDRIWEDLLSEQDKQVITKAGYDKEGAPSQESRGTGENLMILVIDTQRLTVGENALILDAIEEYRIAMGGIAWDATEHIDPLLDFTREQGLPVMYTQVVPLSYDDPDHSDLDIVDPVAPEEGGAAADKFYTSAFYETDLLSWPTRGDHDSVIAVGNSTSGYVRATVVDAKQNSFSVVLPQECTFDHIEASHKIGLPDLWMKYAEVLETEAVEEWVETL